LAIFAGDASLQKEEPVMTINLPEDLERFIRSEVLSGHFASEQDALLEAVRLLQRQVTKTTSTLAKTPSASTSDQLLGSMRDAAEELDEVVAEAMQLREQQPWRLACNWLLETSLITNASSSSAIRLRLSIGAKRRSGF
jgi:Arc/MetJ-type ribon-helix-helix transcriptional regulator